jgi:hypothetical protein
MPSRDPADMRLNRLRQWRNTPARDDTMAFLKKQFKAEVEKPYKQLESVVEVWLRLVPHDLLAHARLESFSRGVLRVVVDSSAHLYELDRLLRGGLEQRIITEHRGPAFRKIQLHVGDIR